MGGVGSGVEKSLRSGLFGVGWSREGSKSRQCTTEQGRVPGRVADRVRYLRGEDGEFLSEGGQTQPKERRESSDEGSRVGKAQPTQEREFGGYIVEPQRQGGSEAGDKALRVGEAQVPVSDDPCFQGLKRQADNGRAAFDQATGVGETKLA